MWRTFIVNCFGYQMQEPDKPWRAYRDWAKPLLRQAAITVILQFL